jgi:hypothetical protein
MVMVKCWRRDFENERLLRMIKKRFEKHDFSTATHRKTVKGKEYICLFL